MQQPSQHELHTTLQTVATTHFRELFEHNLLKYHLGETGELVEDKSFMLGEAIPLQFLQMKVMFQERDPKSPNAIKEVVPLFKVQKGVADESFGLSCAALAGVHMDVLERASYVSKRFTRNLPLAPWLTDVQREEHAWLSNVLRKLLVASRSADSATRNDALKEAWGLLQPH
eukprot:gb/GECG01000743.1/.p1 GENE.gb/GECG01000743.1/~~gb/GECG01000743.1/.p1  ORF type:complete len:172 (+),score=22.97 gb/GECG01000743.1/:1-516(+)